MPCVSVRTGDTEPVRIPRISVGIHDHAAVGIVGDSQVGASQEVQRVIEPTQNPRPICVGQLASVAKFSHELS